ncbi:uncharacterized protein G2W53_003276 [Senna tora]|uniref:Uncharacterized protein n=1 Tax=Senna tora TaxID=362788 RepID=A0A834XAZ8_9FABA|nr:uncharacterized protein G2W53_003276 [Senna tora]
MAPMATSIINTKTSLTLQFDEHLKRLKASEASSSSSLISQNLKDLHNLHGYIDKMLQFPITKQALARECCEKRVDELFEEGSLRLLDVSSVAKEVLIQAKDSVKELQSAIRRRRRCGAREVIVPIEKFLSSRRKAKKEIQKTLENLKGHNKKDVTLSLWSWTRISTRTGRVINLSNTVELIAGGDPPSTGFLNKECDESVSMIRNLKEAQVITLSLLQSLLSFMYGSLGQSKHHIKWSILSKLMMQSKRVACDFGESILMSNTNEFEKLDMKLQFLLCHKNTFSIEFGYDIENFQNQLENLELSIEDLEEGIENLQRGLLSGLLELHACIQNLVQLSTIQESLAKEPQEKSVEELLDGSLRLLDVCTSTKEALLHTKECTRELHSIVRRRRRSDGVGEMEIMVEAKKFLASRKVVKKAILKALGNLKVNIVGTNYYKCNNSSLKESCEDMGLVRLLRGSEVVTLSVFESLLCYISGSSSSSSSSQSKQGRWNLVSKIMHRRRRKVVTSNCGVEAEDGDDNEFAKLDGELQCFVFQSERINDLQKKLEKLECCIQDIEEGLDFLFRLLIKIRVSLLNILNH